MKSKYLLSFLFSFFIVGALFIKPAFADTVTLSGNVQTSTGSAISGATVSVNDSNNDSTTTDSNGNYTMTISSGTYNVQVTPASGSGFSSAVAVSQNISSNTTLNFILTLSGTETLSGTIDDSSGAPLANQTVTLEGTNNTPITTTTNSSGNYSLQVSAGNYGLTMSGNTSSFPSYVPQQYSLGFGSTTGSGPYPISLTQDTVLNVTLPTKQVTVHIQDASGNPISGVAVKANLPGGGSEVLGDIGNFIEVDNNSDYGSTTGPVTDSSGNATVWLLPNNGYAFTATPPNGSSYTSSTLSNISISGNTQETITLQQPVTFSGTIDDSSGAPLANQTVTLEGTNNTPITTTTNSSGNYSLQVSAGNYGLTMSGNTSSFPSYVPQQYSLGFGSTTGSGPYPISLTQNTTLNVTLPTKQVTVHIQDAFGNPISGIAVKANLPGGGSEVLGDIGNFIEVDNNSDYGSTTGPVTDSSGNATVWLLPNNGYAFTATPPNGSSYTSSTLSNISISGNTQETITLQQPVTFSGTIDDSSGAPLANQTVTLEGTNNTPITTTTNSSGNYSLQVSAGNYGLTMSGNTSSFPSYVPQQYSLGFGSTTGSGPYPISLTQNTTLNVTLPTKQVTVHVQDASGNPISGIAVKANLPGGGTEVLGDIGNFIEVDDNSDYGSTTGPVTDSSGNATVWLLPNNNYTFTATPSNGSIYNTFTLNNISVSGNQTEIVSLQYNHATPVTTAALSPSPYADSTYPDPTTVTLSATPASGYTVANTYYTVDNGSQRTYSTPFTVTGSGSHTITYWSVDNSGEIESKNTKNFTISEAYTVSGTVYVDTNQNGFQDQGELGYAGATVTLNTGQSTTTDSNGNYSFPNLESGSYTETLTLPSGYTATTTNPVSFALESNTTENFGIVQPTSLAFAVNAGGSTAGNYVADIDYNGGSTYSTSATIDTSGVSNPAPEAVYQSVRYGNFSYTIPNLSANGTYTVQLQFSEPYWGTSQAGGGGVGSRVFNVSVNGTQALSDFDVYAAAGGANKAVMEQIPATADSNGNITITFSSVVDNAMVSGIAVYNGTLPSPTPSPTPTPVTYEAISAGGQGSGNYVADTDYLGGTTYSTSANIDTSNVTNPAPQAVYQAVRYGNFSYTIPTYSPNTNYTVRLHFSEPYWQSAGQREFNVSINGTQVLNNFDVYQTAGGKNTAVAEQFNTTSDSNGFIKIQFNSVVDNAMVSGIEITQQ